MSESYEVKAILTAEDKNFSSTFASAEKTASGFGSNIMKTVGLGMLQGAGQKVFGMVTDMLSSSMDGAISRIDTLNQFPKMMEISGYATRELADSVVNDLSNAIDRLPTKLDDVVSATQSLTMLNGDVERSGKLAMALNDAFLASGSSSEDAARGMKQYSQMMAKGKVDAQSWYTLQETMGAALKKTAEALGYEGPNAMNELYDALQNGTVTFEEFEDQLMALDEGVGGFRDTARAASEGIATSWTNIKTAVSKGVASMISALDQAMQDAGFGSIVDNLDNIKAAIKATFEGLSGAIGPVFAMIAPYLQTFIEYAGQVGSAFGEAFGAVGEALGSTISEFLNSESTLESFKQICEGVANALKSVAGFIKDHAQEIADLAPKVLQAYIAYSLFKSALSIGGKVKTAGKALQKLGEKLGLLPSQTKPAKPPLDDLGDSMDSAGQSTSGFMDVLAGAAALLAFGAMVVMVAFGFKLLADAAVQVADSGPAAIGVLFGMVAAIAALMAVASYVGPGLTAGAVGMLAFGAAMIMIGVAGILAAVALQMVAAVLPTVVTYGTDGAVAITALGAALLVFAVGAALAGVAGIVLGAGLIVAGAGALVLAAGLLVLGAVCLVVGNGLTVLGGLFEAFGNTVNTILQGLSTVITAFGEAVTSILTAVAGIFDSMGTAALNAGLGAESLANGIQKLVNLPLGDLSGTLAAVALGLKSISKNADGLQTAGSGMTQIANGLMKIQGSASGASAGLSSFSSAVRSAASSVRAGMNQISSSASSGMNRFNSAMNSGASRAISISSRMISSILSTMRSGASGTYSVGLMIGMGLANGMMAALGAVTAAANALVAQANRAAAAKAQIGSPSKITRQYGEWWGLGFALGIESMYGRVQDASEGLIGPVNEQMRDLEGMELSDQFDYYRNEEYVIYVPLEINGKEIAKATAKYNREEIDALNQMENAVRGIR